MLLKHKKTGSLVEVMDIRNLTDPFQPSVMGRLHSGEEQQEPERVAKSDLVFPSDEKLPRCWFDPDYKKKK